MISALVVAAIMLVAASLEASAHSLRRDADALTEIALDLWVAPRFRSFSPRCAYAPRRTSAALGRPQGKDHPAQPAVLLSLRRLRGWGW